MRIALSLLALATACSSDGIGAKSSPIRDGTRTDGDPAVVAIIARRARCVGEDPTLLCTGTVVAPKVVLTAAHCLDAFGEDGAYEVSFGAALDAGQFVWVRRAKAHPDYVADTHENDVALLELDEPAPTAPVTVAKTALATLRVGARARIVGFGETRTDGEPPGIKRTGDTTIDAVSEKDFHATPLPSMSCAGDSGGPVFVADESGEVLAGITVKGDPACKSFAVNLRVDAYWSSFVQPFVDEVATSAPPKTPTIAGDAICSKTCGSSDVCPRQSTCLPDDDGASRCTTPALGVGAYSGACTRDDQCGGGAFCAHVGPDACACFRPCDAHADPEDASPAPAVVHAGGGGCSTHRASRTNGALFACLLLAVVRRARSRPPRSSGART